MASSSIGVRVVVASLLFAATSVAASAVAQSVSRPFGAAEHGVALTPLLTESELRAWNSLRNETAREEFVSAFWDEHDPTPGTPVNERREIFEVRARRALETLGEGTTPGYATDRGRVLLVYGLPDEQELRAVPEGAPAQLRWRYSRHAQALTVSFRGNGDAYILDAAPELSVDAFLRTLGNDLRLLLANAVGDQHGALERPEPTPLAATPPAPGTPEVEVPGSGAELSTPDEPQLVGAATPEALPPAELAPEVKLWMEMVFGATTRTDIPLRQRLHFFPALEGTYAALSFELGKEQLTFVDPIELVDPLEDPPLAAGVDSEGAMPSASLDALTSAVPAEPVEASARLRVFGAFLQGERGKEDTLHSFIIPYELAASAGDAESSAALSLGVTLFPGEYRLAWGVLDMTSGKAVTRDELVQVPDFTQGRLGLTPPLLAGRELRDDPRPMDTSTIYEGVRLGGVLVANNVDDVFARDSTVEVLTVATGWASDPAAPGKPRLEVTYRILEGLEGDESLARLPEQLLDFHVLGQQIPLGQVNRLRPGRSYRIEVRVKDLIGGGEVVQRAPIHLRAEEPAEDGEAR